MNKLQINRMATIVLFAVLMLVSSVALAQKPIKRPPKKVGQTTTQQIAKPPKKTVAPAKPTTGLINGHEWVDLGLSVKWATTNVGAGSATDCGYYFAWGEAYHKLEYTYENCRTMGKDLPDISGNSEYDAAHDYWGGSWRMPTHAEFKELSEKCKWEYKNIIEWGYKNGSNEISGYNITGPNGNSIFLPAAGCRVNEEYGNMNELGLYWSSTPSPNIDPNGENEHSYTLDFQHNGRWVDLTLIRFYGLPIRPVTN